MYFTPIIDLKQLLVFLLCITITVQEGYLPRGGQTDTQNDCGDECQLARTAICDIFCPGLDDSEYVLTENKCHCKGSNSQTVSLKNACKKVKAQATESWNCRLIVSVATRETVELSVFSEIGHEKFCTSTSDATAVALSSLNEHDKSQAGCTKACSKRRGGSPSSYFQKVNDNHEPDDDCLCFKLKDGQNKLPYKDAIAEACKHH